MTPHVIPTITVAGSNATSFIEPNLISLVYKESVGHGGGVGAMGDTVDIEFADPNGQFRKSWSVANASQFTLSLTVAAFTRTMGQMTVKTIRIRQDKHRGTTIQLSATS